MTLHLLIDECLSPNLVELAIHAGYVESTCLRDRGLLGTQDWTLMKHVLAEDLTLVTVNAQDFRGGGQDAPGGLYATTELHAGLICLSSARAMDLNAQRVLFEAALEVLSTLPDLINQVLEVTEEVSGDIVVSPIPRSRPPGISGSAQSTNAGNSLLQDAGPLASDFCQLHCF